MIRWIWFAISKNKVAYLLITTVIIGVWYQWVDWPSDNKVILLNGKEGFPSNWHYWFLIIHFLMNVIFLICASIPNKSTIDYDVLYSYIVWEGVGAYSFAYEGWYREDPWKWFVIGFCLTCVTFVLIRIFRLKWKRQR